MDRCDRHDAVERHMGCVTATIDDLEGRMNKVEKATEEFRVEAARINQRLTRGGVMLGAIQVVAALALGALMTALLRSAIG